MAMRARSTVSALRPFSDVNTLAPCSTRRPPTAAPMLPGAMTATTGASIFPLYLVKLLAIVPPCDHQCESDRLSPIRSLSPLPIQCRMCSVSDLDEARYQLAVASRMLAHEGVL